MSVISSDPLCKDWMPMDIEWMYPRLKLSPIYNGIFESNVGTEPTLKNRHAKGVYVRRGAVPPPRPVTETEEWGKLNKLICYFSFKEEIK